MAHKPLLVYVELGPKKVFASAVDWPGWSRSGRTEEAALSTLGDYADRYAIVAARAGLPFGGGIADTIEVVDRLQGDASTDFGVPGRTHEGERVRVTPTRAKRFAALLQASWDLLEAEAKVAPEHLRRGPRGGGRDRDKLLEHVIGAEAGYARQLGIKHKQPALGDAEALAALRADLLAVIGAPNDGSPIHRWTTPYATRRIAWHVLDHLWEMQDKS
jgi:hypothetical protein